MRYNYSKSKMVRSLFAILLIVCLTSCDQGSEGPVESTLEPESGMSGSAKNILTEGYLRWQYAMVEKFGLDIEIFKEQKTLAEWLGKVSAEENPEIYFVSNDRGFLEYGPRYKVDASGNDTYYCGGLKGDYPDGYGIIFRSSYLEGQCDIEYIGHFSEGRRDGYGLLFTEPQSENFDLFHSMMLAGQFPEEQIENYYHAFINYVSYEGDFKENKVEGDGNAFACEFYLTNEMARVDPNWKGKSFSPEMIPYVIETGEFENREENGKIKRYARGVLVYDGNMKNGVKDGKGIEYDLDGNIIYDGTYSNGNYDEQAKVNTAQVGIEQTGNSLLDSPYPEYAPLEPSGDAYPSVVVPNTLPTANIAADVSPTNKASMFDAMKMVGNYNSSEGPEKYLDLTVTGGRLYIRLQSYRVTEVDTSIDLPTEPTFSAQGETGTYTFYFDENAGAVEVIANGYSEWYSKDELSTEGYSGVIDAGTYILPTDSQYISEFDLYGMSQDEVALARNEIYARYGYSFKSDSVRTYFAKQNWYIEDPNVNVNTFGTDWMNDYEQTNLKTIQDYEKKMGWK